MKKKLHEQLPPDILKMMEGKTRIAGTDEAGRGPLAGPVSAAAVILKKNWQLPGLRDSKKLTETEREFLFEEIISNSLTYGIALATPEEIDSINILQASVLAMKRAINQLTLPPDIIFVDGNYGIPGNKLAIPIIKGDDLIAEISAASVLAKVTRDRMMKKYHEEFPEYGFNSHKGYPTPTHIQAIKKYGYSSIHRKSFHVKSLSQTELF